MQAKYLMNKKSANQIKDTTPQRKQKKNLNDFWDNQKIRKTVRFINHYDNSVGSVTGKRI